MCVSITDCHIRWNRLVVTGFEVVARSFFIICLIVCLVKDVVISYWLLSSCYYGMLQRRWLVECWYCWSPPHRLYLSFRSDVHDVNGSWDEQVGAGDDVVEVGGRSLHFSDLHQIADLVRVTPGRPHDVPASYFLQSPAHSQSYPLLHNSHNHDKLAHWSHEALPTASVASHTNNNAVFSPLTCWQFQQVMSFVHGDAKTQALPIYSVPTWTVINTAPINSPQLFHSLVSMRHTRGCILRVHFRHSAYAVPLMTMMMTGQNLEYWLLFP